MKTLIHIFILGLIILFNNQFVIGQDQSFERIKSVEEKIAKFNYFQEESSKLLNQEIPAFSGIDILTGEIVDNNTLKGKITVLTINSSAEFCEPSEFQHKELNYLNDKLDTSQYQIITIYPEDEKRLFKNREVDRNGFPILLLDKSVIESIFKIAYSPTNLIIDENGVVKSILKNSSWISLEKELTELKLIKT